MSELDETLNRCRQRSEAAGAVFEVAGRGRVADTVWDEHASGQFTPRGSGGSPRESPEPRLAAEGAPHGGPVFRGGSDVLFKPLGPPRRGGNGGAAPTGGPSVSPAQEGKGRGTGSGGAAGSTRAESPGLGALDRDSLARMDSPGRMYCGAPAAGTGPGGDGRAAMGGVGQPPLPPAELGEPAQQADATVLEHRDSELSRATVDAGAPDLVATAPASPASSPRGQPVALEGRGSAPRRPSSPGSLLAQPAHGGGPPGSSPTVADSDGAWDPTPQASVQRAPARAAPVARAEERPAMSSSSYFRPYVRQQATPPAAPAQAAPADAGAGPFEASRQPFPRAKEAVLQTKLEEAAAEVKAVCDLVSRATSRQQVHPAELQEILEASEGVQTRTGLRDLELERLGWPTQVLKQIREILNHVEHWQRCEEAAKQAIEEGKASLEAVIKALEGILAAWCSLSTLALGPLHVVLGLERRARGAVPMVLALLDQTMVLVRRKPDVYVMRQLETLLRHSATQPALVDLGVAPPLVQALHELNESVQGLPQARGGAPGIYLAVPEVVWRAVVDGDVRTMEAVICQGGLVSGRTRDPQGHSVLWDAIAFGSPEMALLLLRSFPPDMACGVDLGELHPRNGNSLLHLVSGQQVFTPQAEGLFAMIFERMPEAYRMHRNVRGQTFLHVAAGRLRTWVLKFAAVRGLETLFGAPDAAGWTPRSVLEHRLSELGIASQVPARKVAGSARLPPWCRLAALQPPAPGSRPPFADVAVEVQDAHRGAVELHAHCIILAGCSPVWHKALSVARRDGALERGREAQVAALEAVPAPVRLPLDPTICSSSDVALFALRFLYTGETECGFQGDVRAMLQLVRLCSACALPAPLRAWAVDALLACLDGVASAQEAAALLLLHEGDEIGLEPVERCFVARRLLASDAAWRAVGDEVRDRVIERALDALEPYLRSVRC